MPVMLNWPNLKMPLRSCQLSLLHKFFHYTKQPLHSPQSRRNCPQTPAASAPEHKLSLSTARSVLPDTALRRTFVPTRE